MNAPLSLARPGLLAELRALLAVFWREWLIFRRYPTWIVSQLVWPVLLPILYVLSARALAGPDGAEMGRFAQAAGTSDYIGFLVIGSTVYMWQNMSLWSIGYALRTEQLRGTLESNWLSPTRRLSFLLGSSLLQGVTLTVFVLAAALQFRLFYGLRFEGSPLLVLLILLAAMPSIYGTAFAFASLVLIARETNSFVFLVRGLVMMFCGVVYPLSVLPGWMQAAAAWLPPTYAIRAMREAALNGASLAVLWPDISRLLLFGAGLLLLGCLSFWWLDGRARRSGALGQF